MFILSAIRTLGRRSMDKILLSQSKQYYSGKTDGGLGQKKMKARMVYLSAVVGGTLAVWYTQMTVEKGSGRYPKVQIVPDKDLGPSHKYVKYKGFLYPDFVSAKVIQEVQNFPVEEDDVFVASFPKSGTTWLQEVVYLIVNGVQLAKAKEKTIDERFPYLEFVYPGVKEIQKMPSPRLIKTHLPYSMLPVELRSGKGRVLYIARNPKDVTISYYHFVKNLTVVNFKQDFSVFFNKFLDDMVPYSPWWRHVKEAWARRGRKNVFFITYEEMQQDITGSIEKIASFLGKSLTKEEVMQIAAFCSFSHMKGNSASNYTWFQEAGIQEKGTHFMRKGQVGDWKNVYQDDMSAKIEKLCEERLKESGLQFLYQIGEQ